jgi:hypothetical protein
MDRFDVFTRISCHLYVCLLQRFASVTHWWWTDRCVYVLECLSMSLINARVLKKSCVPTGMKTWWCFIWGRRKRFDLHQIKNAVCNRKSIRARRVLRHRPVVWNFTHSPIYMYIYIQIIYKHMYRFDNGAPDISVISSTVRWSNDATRTLSTHESP